MWSPELQGCTEGRPRIKGRQLCGGGESVLHVILPFPGIFLSWLVYLVVEVEAVSQGFLKEQN